MSPRVEARRDGSTTYLSAKPCVRGHTSSRLVSDGHCIRCDNDRNRARRRSGGDRHDAELLRIKRQRKATPERRAAHNRKKRGVSLWLRLRINKAISRDQRAGSAVRDLGCTIPQFRSYIEAMFTDEMSWDNRGSVWELDHVRRLADFDLTDREQFLTACHFTNYQPLTIEAHRRKSADECTKTLTGTSC